MSAPPPAPGAAARLDDGPRYRPFDWRRRLGIVALAVATALGVIWALLDPPGGVQRPRALGAALPASSASMAAAGPANAPEVCRPGQQQGCVGGTLQVLPAAAPGR